MDARNILGRARTGARIACAAAAIAVPDHLLVTATDGVVGSLASLELSPPWTAQSGLEAAGARAVARHSLGLHFIVCGSPDDEVQVVDPATWETIRRIPTGAGSDPRDILVAGPSRAYVSLYERPYLLVVDPSTGAALDSVDLAPFADADGLPDAARMASDGVRLFVQLQRLDRPESWMPVPPSLLAVLELATGALVDADPAAPGTQGIRLTGLHPVNDMQLEGNSLFVMEQGSTGIIDADGGVDEIDLGTLRARGFLTTDVQLGAHVDAFLLVSPAKGYAITHTDWTLSSHLTSFARPGGEFVDEVYAVIGSQVNELAYDPVAGRIYFPDSSWESPGVRVFDAVTDSLLTPGGVATGLPPADLLVVRGVQPSAVAPPLAGDLALSPPSPNPFRDRTELRLRASAGTARLAVHDAAGRLVRVLAEGDLPSERALGWDGRAASGAPVAPGVYFARLTSGGDAVTRRIVRLR